MTQPSDRIQQMMAKFQEEAAKAGQLREQIQEIKGQARSEDGAVTVTVAPSGAVLDLRLEPDAMRKTHSALQQSILGAIREATRNAAQQMDDTVRPVLGDRAEQFKNAYQAHSPGGTDVADPVPESDAAQPEEASAPDDDDFSDGSFLR